MTGLTADQITTRKKNYAKDLNIDDRIAKLKDIIKNEHGSRIPLCYFTDLANINILTKIDYRIILHLGKEMKRLFESRKVLATRSALPTPDVKIIFTKVPCLQYE